STRLACMVFLTLPMALVGGLLLAFEGTDIPALGAFGGCLAVWTIAVRNGITLINCYRHLERHTGAAFGRELVVRGAGERFGPTLMTAIVTGVAFLPFLLFGEDAGLEMVRPMAGVTLGGLVTATLFNLFVMPAFYLRFGASSQDRDDVVLEEEGTSALQHG
ncbi:MAG: efflux RND transporter permease subunit, partial [Burkholderiales bacterium]